MNRRRFIAVALVPAVAALAALWAPNVAGAAQNADLHGFGIVYLHGKGAWPGGLDGGILSSLEDEGALVAKMEYTFGQFGAETVRSLPETPCWITRARFGISPRTNNGFRMSHSAPFTPRTMTRGLDAAVDWAFWATSCGLERASVMRSNPNR